MLRQLTGEAFQLYSKLKKVNNEAKIFKILDRAYFRYLRRNNAWLCSVNHAKSQCGSTICRFAFYCPLNSIHLRLATFYPQQKLTLRLPHKRRLHGFFYAIDPYGQWQINHY